jgi:hypothetical protein
MAKVGLRRHSTNQENIMPSQTNLYSAQSPLFISFSKGRFDRVQMGAIHIDRMAFSDATEDPFAPQPFGEPHQADLTSDLSGFHQTSLDFSRIFRTLLNSA